MAIWIRKKCMERKLYLRIEKGLAFLQTLYLPVECIRNHTVLIFPLHKSVNTLPFEADFSCDLAFLILLFHVIKCLNHSLSQLAAIAT